MALAAAFFFAFAVYGVASPYLSVLVRGLGYQPSVVGLLLGIFEVVGLAGPFLIGGLADRTGRYRAAVLGSIALIVLPLVPLVAFRSPLASGLALAVLALGLRSVIPVIDAAATLVLGPAGNYGRIRSIGSVSFVLAALGLQYVPFMRPSTPANIGAWLAISAACFAVAATFLPARRPEAPPVRLADRPRAGEGAAPPGKDAPFRPGAALVLGLVVIALGRLAMAPIASFFSLYVAEELRWDAIGLMWALAAASEIPLMILSTRLIGRFGAPRLLGLALVAIAARLAIYAAFPSPAGAVAGQLLHSLCYGLFHPAAVAFISTHVPPERRAFGMALYLSLGVGLPTFVGSATGGFVVEALGYRGLFASYIVFAAAGLAVYAASRGRLEATVP